jgi:hypothetical protein
VCHVLREDSSTDDISTLSTLDHVTSGSDHIGMRSDRLDRIGKSLESCPIRYVDHRTATRYKKSDTICPTIEGEFFYARIDS